MGEKTGLMHASQLRTTQPASSFSQSSKVYSQVRTYLQVSACFIQIQLVMYGSVAFYVFSGPCMTRPARGFNVLSLLLLLLLLYYSLGRTHRATISLSWLLFGHLFILHLFLFFFFSISLSLSFHISCHITQSLCVGQSVCLASREFICCCQLHRLCLSFCPVSELYDQSMQ